MVRFPRTQSATDGSAQTTRSAAKSRRLPPERDDVRELPQIARVQLERGHVGEITCGDEGRCRKLPFIMRLVFFVELFCLFPFHCSVVFLGPITVIQTNSFALLPANASVMCQHRER